MVKKKKIACNTGDSRDMDLIPGLGRFPWRRKRFPTPVFLSGEFHGQRSLVSYSPESESDTTEWLRTPIKDPGKGSMGWFWNIQQSTWASLGEVKRPLKEGFWEQEVLSHAACFGQWNVSRNDPCHFQMETRRARMCFSMILLFPSATKSPEFPSSAQLPDTERKCSQPTMDTEREGEGSLCHCEPLRFRENWIPAT